MGKDIGVINLTSDTSQKDLKKLNKNGFDYILDIVIDDTEEIK